MRRGIRSRKSAAWIAQDVLTTHRLSAALAAEAVGEAVAACDRGLSGDPGRSIQLITYPVLAAVYAALNRQQDAERERAVVARLWPFFNARTFAGQYATEEAQDFMFEGLKKAGFR